MKRQLVSIGAVLLVCSLIMCVGQAQIPEKFFEEYSKIEASQNDIDSTFNSYWDQQTKRIDYATKNMNNHDIDYLYMISMLKTEQQILDEIADKKANYSTQISGFYESVKQVEGNDATSKANELIITLRKSEQYLGNAVLRYSTATNAVGTIMNYYATDANLSDPEIIDAIEAGDLTARTNFRKEMASTQYYKLNRGKYKIPRTSQNEIIFYF